MESNLRRFTLLVTLCMTAGLLVALPQTAHSAKRAPLKCSKISNSGKNFRFCTGKVTSKDKVSNLDADVTLPARGDGPFPLIVMLHGLGGSKESYGCRAVPDGEPPCSLDPIEGEGGKYHYNNLWFASRGYAVLNYTARGFKGSSCLDTSVESVDGNTELYGPSPACRPQASHINYDVKDIKFLTGRLADETLVTTDVDVKARKLGITGVSLGGGPTWVLSRQNTWRSPKGAQLRVAAAVPVISWTDLADALVPNGRVRDDTLWPTEVALREAQPIGVPKITTIGGFFATLTIASSDFQIPGYLDTWYDRFNAGPPYDDQIAADALHKLLVNRSAYYVPKKPFDTPVYAVQGWTDFPFPASQSLTMWQRYLAEEEDVPMRIYFGDFGHPISQNKAAEAAYIFQTVNDWIDYFIKGKGEDPSGVLESRRTICDDADTLGELTVGNDWEVLHSDHQHFSLELSGTLSTDADDPHAARLDPINEPRNECRVTDTAVAAGNIAVETLMPGGFEMLGMPDVTLNADPSREDMYVAAHLWDVDPVSGEQTLVDRGVHRLASDQLQENISFQLFGNNYRWEPGHSIKLELTANDSAFENPAGAGTIEISNVTMSLPVANVAAKQPL